MAAPLRINRPKPAAFRTATAPTPGGDGTVEQDRAGDDDRGSNYLERLTKLIPGEVVALYVGGSALIEPDRHWLLLIWSLVGLVALVALRTVGTRDPATGKGPQWTAITLSIISYAIWIYTLGGPFAAFGIHDPTIGRLLVMGWTFFIPIFYRGD